MSPGPAASTASAAGEIDPGPHPPTSAYRALAAVARPLVRLFYRPTASGLEHAPGRGFVLSSGQVSNLDGFALANALHPRQVRWMGKAELFRGPIAPLFRALGLFPVRRGTGDLQAVETAVELAQQGHPVGIFPEGTRREKGWRKTHSPKAHTGAARVALAAGVPLVPAAVVGTERLTLLRRWRVALGEPVRLDDLEGDGRTAAREATARLMAAIAGLETDLRAETARAPRRLHPRLLLDVSFADLLFAATACAWARGRDRPGRLLAGWGEPDGLACLSLRSAFDLLLTALALEWGDEVAFSAITHPDMPRIAAAHGLRAIPVDVDPETLAPTAEALERAVSPRTRVLVVAHLFGGRVELAPLADLAQRHGLLLVEDCAQCLSGPRDRGDERADVSLFSFGPIKTATALGGALARVGDPELAARMRALQSGWPVQPRRWYARRVLKCAGLRALGRPRAYWLFARALARTGRDLDAVVGNAVRGFPGADLELERLRRRPPAPLLAVLARRLTRFDADRLAARARAGDRLASAWPAGATTPGGVSRSTHWVFPVLAENRLRFRESLRAAGFDAAVASSGIAVVPAPEDRPGLRAEQAEQLFARIVFLPAYPELGERELDRLASAVARALDDDR